jgi:hypothetical protein
VNIGLITAVVYFIKKRENLKRIAEQDPDEGNDDGPELPQGGHHEKIEVPAIYKPGELCGELISGLPDVNVALSPVSQGVVGQDEEWGQDLETHELQ